MPLISTRGLSMSYPGVRALDAVDFDVEPGEVHAVVGQNGAGKSTLIKILSGEIDRYQGELRFDGRLVRFRSPSEAISAGIAVIPQELQIVSALPAADNIFLGREPCTSAGLVDTAAMERRAADAMEALGEALPSGPVGFLEAGQRQLVAIARALSLRARLLVMDEPSSSLGPSEASRLERLVAELAGRGVAVVYVSHRLEEVRRLASRVTVLRDGRRVATLPVADANAASLVRLMAGRVVARSVAAVAPAPGGELLRVESLSLADPTRHGGYRLRDISLTVRRGEIVGLAGLVGAGRTDFLLALAGALDGRVEGRIVLDGSVYHPASPVHARRSAVVLLPEDRKAHGIFPDLGVQGNVTIGRLAAVSDGWMVNGRREAESAAEVMRQVGVRCASASVPIATLSGGNQQKALLARCLFASPSLLLLDEPTRGVDVAAKEEIYSLVRGLAARGFGIILCSSELPEILALSHRVLVFKDGRVARSMDREEATEEKILTAATQALDEPARDAGGRGGDSGGSPPAPPPPFAGRLSRFASLFGLLAVVALAILFSPVRGGRPVFLEVGNLTDILRQVAEKGILAAGMTPVIISAGIDLSVGSVLALSATLTAALLMWGGLDPWTTAFVVLGAGCLWGLLNGVAIARWRLPAFIVTLATMSAARGVARYVSGGAAIPLGFGADGAPESFRALAAPVVPFVPVPALVFLATVGAVWLLIARMRTGRYIYAIGDNEPAARLSGVDVRLHKTLVYVLSAGLAAVAGIIHCAQLEQGNPNDGVGYELDAIAAVVIGGTSLAGGVGTVGGTLVGTLIIGIINNSMGLNNVDANLQLILKGAIILAAVWLQTRRST